MTSPTHPGAPTGPTETAVIREAAQWLARLHSGTASPQDLEACQRWRAAHPAHEQAWQKAERLKARLGLVPPELGVPVLTRTDAPAPPSPSSPGRRAAMRTAGLLVLGGGAWLAWPHRPGAADYRTATGERHDITLADGSRLQLNSGSAIDVRFDAAQRRIVLREGEILVQTAPDPSAMARPFIVESVHGRLRALGTRFAVRLLEPSQHGAATRLVVFDGRVEASPRLGGAARIVAAGEQVHLDASAASAPSPHAGEAAMAGWARGVLYADDMPLGAFLAELSRHRPGLLRCAPEVAELRISGAFQLADSDRILDSIAATLPVQVQRRTRYWVSVIPAR